MLLYIDIHIRNTLKKTYYKYINDTFEWFFFYFEFLKEYPYNIN